MAEHGNGMGLMGPRSVVSAKVVRRIEFDVPNRGTSLAWSHDAKRVAVAGILDGHVSVWDVTTGDRLPGPVDVGGIDDLAFSPDGRYLATVRAPSAARAGGGDQRYTVSLWDAQTGARVRNIVETDTTDVPQIAARSVAFSDDGRYLAVAYAACTIVYALAADGGVHRASLFEVSASRCAFQPGDPVLACLELGRHDRTVVLRVSDGRVLKMLEGDASALAWSPDGRWLARMTGSRLASIYNVATGALLFSVADDATGACDSVSFSADGRLLAAGSPGRITVWDTRTWSEAAVLSKFGARVSQVSFSPQGMAMAAVSERCVMIWELVQQASRPAPTGHTRRPRVHVRARSTAAPRVVESEVAESVVVESVVAEELVEATR